MADEPRVPRPPAEARQPTEEVIGGIPFRNTDPAADRSGVDRESAPPAREEPREETLTGRSLAGVNFAEDQEQQARDRGAGLGAGSSANRDARHPAQSDGEVPEDDLD